MKNLPAIILLFVANTISGIAQGMSMMAIPWYFASQGEMGLFGGVYLFINLFLLLWSPYSGVLVDRYNRKHVFLWLTVICGTILAAIAAWGYWSGALDWYWVALVFVMTFLNYNVHYPNLYAFVQEISEPRYYGKITSYIEIQGQLSAMLAGAGAALLLEGIDTSIGSWTLKIRAWEIHEIFAIDAATYFVALLIISLMSYQPLVKRNVAASGILPQLKVGYEYLKANRGIFLFGIASFSNFVATLLITFFAGAWYVNNQLQAGGDVFATSEIFYAIGAVFAGVAIRWIFQKMPIPMGVIILTIAGGILCAVLATTNHVYLFYLMLFILGIANAGTRILRTTYLFQRVPNEVYGRASSILFLTNISFRVLFLIFFSFAFFQQGNNVVYVFALLSGFLFLSAAVLIRFYQSFVKAAPLAHEKLV